MNEKITFEMIDDGGSVVPRVDGIRSIERNEIHGPGVTTIGVVGFGKYHVRGTLQEVIAKLHRATCGPEDVTLREAADALATVEGPGVRYPKFTMHTDGSGHISHDPCVAVTDFTGFNLLAAIASLKKPKPEPNPLQESHAELLATLRKAHNTGLNYADLMGVIHRAERLAEGAGTNKERQTNG